MPEVPWQGRGIGAAMGCVAMNHNTKNAPKIKTLGAALIAVCALQTTAVVAETITHRVEVPMRSSNWNTVLNVPQFDGALGTLTSVEVVLAGACEVSTRIENRCEGECTTLTGANVTFRAANSRGLTLAEVVATKTFVNRLSRFDGRLDFLGTSGASNGFQPAATAGSGLLEASSVDLSEFIGTGTVGVRATATARGGCEGAGFFRFVVQTRASLAVEVVYTYEPVVIAADEALGSIGNRVWKDKDGDGRQEVNENGLKGWLVELKSGSTVIASVETGKDGEYGFTDVPAGVYTVKVTAKKGYRGTSDLDGNATPGEAVIEVLAGQAIENADFGFVKNSGTDNNDDDDDDDEDCDDDKKGKGRK